MRRRGSRRRDRHLQALVARITRRHDHVTEHEFARVAELHVELDARAKELGQAEGFRQALELLLELVADARGVPDIARALDPLVADERALAERRRRYEVLAMRLWAAYHELGQGHLVHVAASPSTALVGWSRVPGRYATLPGPLLRPWRRRVVDREP